jgi:hypothetical protein
MYPVGSKSSSSSTAPIQLGNFYTACFFAFSLVPIVSMLAFAITADDAFHSFAITFMFVSLASANLVFMARPDSYDRLVYSYLLSWFVLFYCFEATGNRNLADPLVYVRLALSCAICAGFISVMLRLRRRVARRERDRLRKFVTETVFCKAPERFPQCCTSRWTV